MPFGTYVLPSPVAVALDRQIATSEAMSTVWVPLR